MNEFPWWLYGAGQIFDQSPRFHSRIGASLTRGRKAGKSALLEEWKMALEMERKAREVWKRNVRLAVRQAMGLEA